MTRTPEQDASIPGYTYGTDEPARSPLTMAEFRSLEDAVGFTEDHERQLRVAGEVLAP